MKKRRKNPSGIRLIVRLCCFFVFVSSLHTQATVWAQGKVTVELQNKTLGEVLKVLKEQTGVHFMYNTQEVNVGTKVSVSLNEARLEEALQSIFQGLPYRYNQVEDYILITPKKESETQQTDMRTVKGKVVDSKGEPLPGVSVVVKNTTAGVATDIEGKFEIRLNSGEEILVFSFVGMRTQEVKANKDNLYVVMESVAELMQEVIVKTGYQNIEKRKLSSSVFTIDGDLVREGAALGLDNMLQGKIPGMNVMGSSSTPGAATKIRIRGSSTISGNREPLWVVDGFILEDPVQISAEELNSLDNVNLIGNAISSLNPQDIERIDVLKDASATAIYGSRASNGVVVIETRAPEPGKINVAYALNLSLTTPDLSDYDLLNAREKLDLEVAAGYFGYFDEAYNRRLKNIQQGYDTDWLSQPLQNAISHQHSLTLDGGNEAFRYAFHLNMNPSDGVMKKSGRDRYAIDVDLQYRLKQFTFRNQLAYDYVKAFNSPYGSFSSYTRLNPYYRYRDDQGQYVYIMDDPGVDVYNPLWNTTLNNKDQSVYNLLTDHFSIDWWVTDALRIKASASVSVRNEEEEVFKSPFHTDFKREKDMARRGTYDVVNSKSIGYEAVLGVSYTKMVKKNYVTFNGGYNVSSTDLRSHGYSVLGFPADELNDPGFGLDYHPEKKPTGNSELSRMAGFFGNLNYTYDNRYFADFSVRADASSRFGADKRWAVFWSAGVGYNLHNEVFLKKLEWVSLLRLRASYGVTGGQNFNPYQAMTTYRFITDKWYGYGSGAEMLALGNDDLKWQSTVQKNFGLDLGMWKDRLTLTFNYYHKLSENSLTDVTLPPSLGFPSYKENLGEVVNEGWEFTLRGFVVKKEDFNIMLSVNGAQNNNKLKKISNSLKAFNEEQDKQVENKVMARYVEGQSLNTIWVVRSLGIDPANGKELFLDKNGKRTYDWNADDYVAEATTDPRLYGNLGLGIFYRGFSLNTYVNYSLGEKAYNQTLVDRVENADKHYNCDRRVLYDRWHKPGDETFFKDVKDASVTRPTSRFVQKNNYLNMTSLNVAYEFNPRLLEPLRIKYLKLAFYMTDLFRISTMKAERGLDYPFARTFTTSLQIRF